MTELPKTAAQDMSTDPAVDAWRTAMGQYVVSQDHGEMQTAFVDTVEDLRQCQAELHDAQRRATDLEQVREELLSEVAEIRAQLERAVGQAEKLRGYWAESSRHRAEIQDRLTRVEADATARQVELTAAYHELGDVVAERDQLRRDLAGAVIARHEAERELADMRPDSTPTKES